LADQNFGKLKKELVPAHDMLPDAVLRKLGFEVGLYKMRADEYQEMVKK